VCDLDWRAKRAAHGAGLVILATALGLHFFGKRAFNDGLGEQNATPEVLC
jgi:hypothetical protein